MSPGEWTLREFLVGAGESISVSNVRKGTNMHTWICSVCVCVRTYMCVLCQTLTSCSPELKVHPQQTHKNGMRSRVCRMLIVYTHIQTQDLEH